LAHGGRSAITTRAICAAADVQPQTIYRQFGDMRGLLAEAAHEGFRAYLASKSSRPRRPDPVDDLRDGWDLHIEFGRQNPALYLLMYGEPDADRRLAAAAETDAILRDLVEAVARAGRLRVDVDVAASIIHATGVGVVIALIGADPTPTTASLSERVREAVLDAVVADRAAEPGTGANAGAAAVHASALRALLQETPADLTPGESLILTELLARIGSPERCSRALG
jgi:AcrR family transcriptional regulator